MKRWLVFILGVLFLAACEGSPVASFMATPTPTCEAGLPAFAQQLEPLAREWDDANTVAGSTPRAALATQIASLQAVRRKVEDIPAPVCGTTIKDHLVRSMDASIDGYVAFLGQKPDNEVSAKFSTASTELAAYRNALQKATMPTDTPTAAP